MQKNIIMVLSSFFSVIFIISLGTNIAYRTNIIPQLKQDIVRERKLVEQTTIEKENRIKQLKDELSVMYTKQKETEEKLQGKLDEEEQIAKENARIAAQAKAAADAKAAKIAADKKAADAARLAAETATKKKSSKKSKAS